MRHNQTTGFLCSIVDQSYQYGRALQNWNHRIFHGLPLIYILYRIYNHMEFWSNPIEILIPIGMSLIPVGNSTYPKGKIIVR